VLYLRFAYTLTNGQNFLTIVADPGTSIFSVTVSAPGGFTDLRQPRISGAALTTTGNVPEPATMFLFDKKYSDARGNTTERSATSFLGTQN
jgi:hypothetical protein